MSRNIDEIEALKIAREDLAASLKQSKVALQSVERRCHELQSQLQGAEAEKERFLSEKRREGQASSEEAAELKVRAEQELVLARAVSASARLSRRGYS